MFPDKLNLLPSNIVMEAFIEPAMEYYEKIIEKITPYLFCDSLIKMVGFQQLIVSRTYQIKREDARSKKGIDYIRECVSQIQKPHDIIDLMGNWYAFDLCFTAPSFVNPMIASNIRKNYCFVDGRFFDCHNCTKIACRENLIWNKSTIVLDFDTETQNLKKNYFKISNELRELNLNFSIKLSSLGGYHINIGLPKNVGSTIFDRNLYHYCLIKELKERGINVDNNSLDPVPIIRAPFSLHYKRLTPSLCVEENSVDDAIDTLKEIENLSLNKRIERALKVSKDWKYSWEVDNSPMGSFGDMLIKWENEARTAIFRKIKSKKLKRTNVGDYLRKGKEMTIKEKKTAFQLLLEEGKSKELASKIIEIHKNKEPKSKREKKFQNKEVILKYQHNIPEKIMHIPPPILIIIIDNSTLNEMHRITGARPISIKADCINTSEAMALLFKNSKLLKNFPRKWNCKSIYLGGLYSAYNFCSQADIIVAVKKRNVWDRDIAIIEELERIIEKYDNDFISVHLLGLDFCKDNDLNTDGAILVFKKLIKSVISTNFNIVLTSDHSGEEFIPYFELLRHQ